MPHISNQDRKERKKEEKRKKEKERKKERTEREERKALVYVTLFVCLQMSKLQNHTWPARNVLKLSRDSFTVALSRLLANQRNDFRFV